MRTGSETIQGYPTSTEPDIVDSLDRALRLYDRALALLDRGDKEGALRLTSATHRIWWVGKGRSA